MELKHAIRETSLDRVETGSGFDAIIVGSGAAGGLASAQLTAAGLKVLVLDAGYLAPAWRRPVSRSLNALVQTLANPAALRWLPSKLIWKGRSLLKVAGRLRQPIQSRCYAWEGFANGFVDDRDNPYETPGDKPFDWIRARHLGGRMMAPAHGKQYLRHGAADFSAGGWPLEPGELDQWYQQVETKLGLRGQTNGSTWVPDSVIAHALEPDPAQARMMATITAKWPASDPILGRYSDPLASLQYAAQTGHLSCRTGAVVRRVLVGQTGRVDGVEYYDIRARRAVEVKAPIVFLCASTLETTRVMLNSRTETFLKDAGSETGALGRYIMDHVSVKVEGIMPDHGIPAGDFSTGNCVYLPRFDLRNGRQGEAKHGYGMRLYQIPGRPGTSYFTAVSDAEMLPRSSNHVALSDRKDRWGVPVLRISCAAGPEENEMADAQIQAIREITDAFDVTLTSTDIGPSRPGAAIHEVGGARMGTSPETSVVDRDNQCWDAKGLYLTDGAAFPAIGLQNPTLTIMALTARACAHATAKTG